MRRLIFSLLRFTTLAVLMALVTACEVPPLQATPQPRKEIIEGAKEMPRIPAPDPAAAEVPEGYRVEVAVKDLVYPSSIDVDREGNLYIAEAGHVYGDPAAPTRIWRVTTDGRMSIIADQLNAPITDILWHDGRLYISHRGKISVLDAPGSTLRDLVTDLPSYGDHHNNQLAIGPDGKLYFGQGVATNSGVVGVDNFVFGWLGTHPKVHDIPARDIKVSTKTFVTLDPMVLTSDKEPPLVRTGAFQPFGQGAAKDGVVKGSVKANGTILRMNTDGSGLEVYAWGLRNPFGVAWGRDGKLYVADNGYDERGSRAIAHAPDCIWSIKQGAWYGFPDFAGGVPVTDKRFKPGKGQTPEFLMKEHPPVEQPLATRPHHVGVAKLDVSPGGAFGFEGDLFLAEVGDMNPITGMHTEHYGYDVVRINPRNGESTVFFRTKPSALGPTKGRMEYAQTAGPKRLVDVRFSPDGNEMYVADIGAIAVPPTVAPLPQPFPGTGVIWRISRGAAGERKLPTNVSPVPQEKADDEDPQRSRQ